MTAESSRLKKYVVHHKSQQELKYYRHPAISGVLLDVVVSIYVMLLLTCMLFRSGWAATRTDQLERKLPSISILSNNVCVRVGFWGEVGEKCRVRVSSIRIEGPLFLL